VQGGIHAACLLERVAEPAAPATPTSISTSTATSTPTGTSTATSPSISTSAPASTPVDEREAVRAALEKSGWVQAKAARLLGMTVRQLGYRVKKYGIALERF
jgi:Nif-specific regulatory protein